MTRDARVRTGIWKVLSKRGRLNEWYTPTEILDFALADTQENGRNVLPLKRAAHLKNSLRKMADRREIEQVAVVRSTGRGKSPFKYRVPSWAYDLAQIMDISWYLIYDAYAWLDAETKERVVRNTEGWLLSLGSTDKVQLGKAFENLRSELPLDAQVRSCLRALMAAHMAHFLSEDLKRKGTQLILENGSPVTRYVASLAARGGELHVEGRKGGVGPIQQHPMDGAQRRLTVINHVLRLPRPRPLKLPRR